MSRVLRSDTADFVRSSSRDYVDLLRDESEGTALYPSSNTAPTMLASRISYCNDLKESSIAVDIMRESAGSLSENHVLTSIIMCQPYCTTPYEASGLSPIIFFQRRLLH